MKDKIKSTEINVNKENIIPIADVKQESQCVLTLELYKDNVAFDITGQTVKLGAKTADGNVQLQESGFTINKNILTVDLKSSINSVVGLLEIDLTFTDSTGVMTTSSFYLNVIKKTLGKDNIIASNQLESVKVLIEDLKTKGNNVIAGIKKDYDSLKKVIIDNNAVANLQVQINENKQQLVENTTRIEQLKDLTPVWQEHDGIGSVTVNDSFDGVTKDLVIKGSTLKNIYDSKHCTGGTLDEESFRTFTLTSNPGWHTVGAQSDLNNVKSSYKTNTIYTIIAEIKENSLTGTGELFRLNEPSSTRILNSTIKLPNNFTGVFIAKARTRTDFNNITYGIYPCLTSSCTGGTIKIRFMIIEGDLSDSEIPKSYFEGNSSFGEQENNKILIKSVGKNLCDNNKNRKIEISSNTGIETYTNNHICSDYIKIDKILNFTASTLKNQQVTFRWYDSNKKYIKSGTERPSNSVYVRLRMYNSNGINVGDDFFQLESGSVATNYEQYRAKLTEIPLPFQEGLKSLPNGTCDEIYDNGKIIQKIEKRVYKSGDELLPNVITDKKNTIIELSKYKTYDINPFFLRTFNETTHLYQENNICGEISFETAKNKDAIINGNTEAISNFDKTSIKLQKELTFIKNETLEMEQDISNIKTNIEDLSEKKAIHAREISAIKEINNQISQKINENKREISGIKEINNQISQKINENKNEITSLKTVINKNKNEITSLKTVINESELNFDITNSEPVYITQCETFKTTVAQGLGYDNVNQEFYMAQAYVNESWGSETEHFVINRCDIHGKLIDSMRCRNGGHGTIFGLERDNSGVIWIWTAWKSASGYELKNKNNVVRIKYKSGDIDLKSYREWSYINTFNNNVYTNVVLSADGDEIAFITDSTITNKLNVKIRKKADVLNATDRIINNIELDNKNSWQSFAFDEKYYYYRTGLDSEIDKIHKIDRVSSVMTIIKPNTGKPINNFKEAEGMCFASSLDNKSKTLLLATVKDVELRRVNQIWCYPHGEIGNQLIGSQSNKLKQFKDNGRCFQPPLNITKMSEITESGWYYFDSNTFSKMLDKPQTPSTGGWLNVSPKNDNGERFVQEFIANNAGSFTQKGFFKVSRVIDTKNPNGIVVWHGTSQEVTLWSSDSNPQLNISVKLSDNWKNFDYLYLKYKCPSGDNSGDQLLSTKYLTGRTITNTLLNLGDSDNVAEFYEHKLELSEDGMSFIPQRRVSTKGNTEAFSIKRIVGVRL